MANRSKRDLGKYGKANGKLLQFIQNLRTLGQRRKNGRMLQNSKLHK